VLRVTTLKNTVAAVTAYFTEGRGDYYAEGMDEVEGRWGGETATRLGLEGDVEKKAFEALCRNERPDNGESLTPRTNRERRIAFDFTFSCPKSVSVMYALTQDASILEAFRASVDDAMRELEAFAETRVRRGRSDRLRRTGNLLWAAFDHETARPVDGYPDMHLHCHAVVFNLTWDEAEGRIKAVDLGEVRKRASYFEASFDSRLALRLRNLGFDIAPKATGGWEIAGVPQRVLDAFSRRTKLIDRRAKELGIADAKTKETLGAKTRERKQHSLKWNELHAKWWAILGDAERRAIRAVHAREVLLAPLDPDAAQRAVQFAAGHVFERQSVVPLESLLFHALRHGIGHVSLKDLRLQLAGFITRERSGTVYITSREVLQEEARLLAFARNGRGTLKPIDRVGWHIFDERFSDEQRAVVRHVLESRDRVVLIRGVAGSGKTTLMKEAVAAMEANGFRVVALAPSSDASRGVLRSEGFPSAETVARFLVDPALQESARDQVLWIDEAGLLGSRTVAEVFDLATSLNARIILAGDERQHASVERGSVLRLLETEAGLPTVRIDAIRRQSGSYRVAVAHLSRGEVLQGFHLLDELGWVLEVDDGEREAMLAADYLEAVESKKTALIISPTHAEGRKITEAVRIALRSKGVLAVDENVYTRLESRRLTEAERGHALRYRLGDVIEFHGNAPAFTKGSRYAVAKVGRASLIVKDHSGRDRILPLGLASRFDVFTAHDLSLSVGEKIRITRNGKSKTRSHRLDNGTVHTVAGFTPTGDIRLTSGAVVSTSFAHLTYGYCITSHAAQGKTVDRVFIAQSSESFPATGREQFYVSASRARESLTVYTNDKASLRIAIQRAAPRMTATELVKPSAHHPAWLAWIRQRVQFVKRMASNVRGSNPQNLTPCAREVTR